MAKYLLLWEVDNARAPEDAKERAAVYQMLVGMVREDERKGLLKDWGGFVGETNGYAVAEGTEVEIGTMIQQYIPFVIFKTRAAGSISQIEEITRAM